MENHVSAFYLATAAATVKSSSAEPALGDYWYTKPDWWVAGFTGALVVATVGLWIFTALLWRVTSKSTDLAARAASDAERSIEAALESARATSAAAQAASDSVLSFQSAERAHLRVVLGDGWTDDSRARFTVGAKNVGRSNAMITALNWQFTSDPEFPKLSSSSGLLNLEVSPSSTPSVYNILVEDVGQYLAIEVVYRTVFGREARSYGFFAVAENLDANSIYGGAPYSASRIVSPSTPSDT